MAKKEKLIKCSFCKKPSTDVEVMIAANDKLAICDECVDICVDTIKIKRAGIDDLTPDESNE